jgi:sugar phosphate isomerase/epimerase
MHRREFVRSLASGLSATALATTTGLGYPAEVRRSAMGVVIYCLGIRSRAERQRSGQSPLNDPLSFLATCRSLGAGGIQMPLGVREAAYTSSLRQAAEKYEMFVEGIARLPSTPADVERFDAEMRTAKKAGANVVRVVIIPGRRYERFSSADEFAEYCRRGLRSLELAEPVAARHGIRLAVENHKDQRVDERLHVLQRISSQHVGACVDLGNSFALLEDPIAVVKAYLPWAASVHIKDQAVQEYEDGFLFADIALGDGFLDLKRMVEILRSAKSDVHFSLEVITRDPLRVPCLTEKYWATFDNVPGRDLARTLRTVRAASHPASLLRVGDLTPEEQVAVEQSNVEKSLTYAREHLQL